MRLIGLTGGIASGKSTVSAMLRTLGARVVDADAIYHELVAPLPDGRPSPLAQSIERTFPGVIDAHGRLDRRLLGGRVFGDPQAREKLGALTHPAVASEFGRRAEILRGEGVRLAFYDVPLLFENGLEQGLAGSLVVWVPADLQRARLMRRDSLSGTEADRRLASQLPLDVKRERATWVIDNSGPRDATRGQVQQLWSDLTGRG